jgi:hypothetical protein
MLGKRVLVMSVVGILFTGCTSSPTEQVYERIEQRTEERKTVLEQFEEKEQEKREEEKDLLPDWILEPPMPDTTGMFGIGIAQSKKLSHALKAARLQAEFELAKMYRQELSGSERAFEQGDSDGNVTSQTIFLIDKLVDSVPVVGYEIVEQVVEPNRGIHNVYVLLKLPYDEFNKVLKQEKAKIIDKKVQANFDDLERRLDKRREQRLLDEKQTFEQEQQALKARAKLLEPKGDALEPSRGSL